MGGRKEDTSSTWVMSDRLSSRASVAMTVWFLVLISMSKSVSIRGLDSSSILRIGSLFSGVPTSLLVLSGKSSRCFGGLPSGWVAGAPLTIPGATLTVSSAADRD